MGLVPAPALHVKRACPDEQHPRTKGMDWTNQLYYGDNLRVLREEIADESAW